jgi:hypothetical protein
MIWRSDSLFDVIVNASYHVVTTRCLSTTEHDTYTKRSECLLLFGFLQRHSCSAIRFWETLLDIFMIGYGSEGFMIFKFEMWP